MEPEEPPQVLSDLETRAVEEIQELDKRRSRFDILEEANASGMGLVGGLSMILNAIKARNARDDRNKDYADSDTAVDLIQAENPSLTRDAIDALIDEEVAKARGLLTRDAAAVMVRRSLGDHPEDVGFKTAAGVKVSDAYAMELSRVVAAEADLDPSLLVVVTEGKDVTARPARFLGDQWQQVNSTITGMGGHWVRPKDNPKDGFWKVPISGIQDYSARRSAEEEREVRLSPPRAASDVAALLDVRLPNWSAALDVVDSGTLIQVVSKVQSLSVAALGAVNQLVSQYGDAGSSDPDGARWMIEKAK